jgi:hypothetical protein
MFRQSAVDARGQGRIGSVAPPLPSFSAAAMRIDATAGDERIARCG